MPTTPTCCSSEETISDGLSPDMVISFTVLGFEYESILKWDSRGVTDCTFLNWRFLGFSDSIETSMTYTPVDIYVFYDWAIVSPSYAL